MYAIILIPFLLYKENLPPGHDALLFSISNTGSFICPVAQTRLGIPRPLFTQSWTTRGKSKCSGTRQIRTADLLVHSPPEVGGSIFKMSPFVPAMLSKSVGKTAICQAIPQVLNGGGIFSLMGGGVVCENSPATCRTFPGAPCITCNQPYYQFHIVIIMLHLNNYNP